MKIHEKPDYLIFADSAKNGECANFPDIIRGWGVTIEKYALFVATRYTRME